MNALRIDSKELILQLLKNSKTNKLSFSVYLFIWIFLVLRLI